MTRQELTKLNKTRITLTVYEQNKIESETNFLSNSINIQSETEDKQTLPSNHQLFKEI